MLLNTTGSPRAAAAQHQPMPNLPDDIDELVWHYTDGPGLISILTGHCLWATASAFLNDRQEIAYGGALIARRIRELAPNDPTGALSALAEKVSVATAEGDGPGATDAYILSASRSRDSLAMWRLYGGAAESYAIGIDPQAPLAVLGGSTTDVGRGAGVHFHMEPWQAVRYREVEQLDLVDTLIASIPRHIAEVHDDLERMKGGEPPSQRVTDTLGLILDDLQEALFLIKHPGFIDERETRFGVAFATSGHEPNHAAAADLLTYRSTAYGIAPFLQLTSPGPDGGPVTSAPAHLPVKAVAISPSPNGEEATTSMRRLLLSRGYDVPVIRSAIPFRE